MSDLVPLFLGLAAGLIGGAFRDAARADRDRAVRQCRRRDLERRAAAWGDKQRLAFQDEMDRWGAAYRSIAAIIFAVGLIQADEKLAAPG